MKIVNRYLICIKNNHIVESIPNEHSIMGFVLFIMKRAFIKKKFIILPKDTMIEECCYIVDSSPAPIEGVPVLTKDSCLTNLQTTKNVKIPTLEELQQRFHAVPRFRDPNKREYVWFHADDVARVFGYSDFNEDLMYSVQYADRVCPGKKIYRGVHCQMDEQGSHHLGPECQPFLQQYKNVINQLRS